MNPTTFYWVMIAIIGVLLILAGILWVHQVRQDKKEDNWLDEIDRWRDDFK